MMRNNSGFTYVILALFLGSFSQSVVGANDGLAVLPTPSTRASMRSVADANDSQPVVISPHGSDMNPGTPEQPMATLEAARDLIRESGNREKRIMVMPGEYYLTKPLELDNRDNGLIIEGDTSGQSLLFGGTLTGEWKREGNTFYSLELPGIKEGRWDARTLIVNGRLAEKARIPEEGTLQYRNEFRLDHQGGVWANKPGEEDYTRLQYNPSDLPATLDIKNAEVRVYHMWDESLCGVSRKDESNHELWLASRTLFPIGSMEKKEYVIFNTREGMTKPGQWYLDRSNGKIVYWPLEGEEMASLKIVVPTMEYIIRVTGDSSNPVKDVTIRGLAFQGTNVPLKTAGATCSRLDGAVSVSHARNCTIEKLEITAVGGNGIVARDLSHCQITDCLVHHVGGTGIWQSGDSLFVARNYIHNVGLYYPSAIGLASMGQDQHVYRNVVHDVPYCGMNVCCVRNLVEENLIYRVMLELHDGAAIYVGGGYGTILRGNVARDIKSVGQGYGISAYYLDEGTRDCLIENNVSVGVERPVHNHIAFNSTIRDNVFITDGVMNLSFQRSSNFEFKNNVLVAPGKIRIEQPNGISVWEGNRVFNEKGHMIDSIMPEITLLPPREVAVEVPRLEEKPVLDGIITDGEWPGSHYALERAPERLPASGRPVFMKLLHDEKYLYVGVLIDMFRVKENLREGDVWERDDGVEIAIAGRYRDKPVTFIIRSYASGAVQCLTDGEVPEKVVTRLSEAIRYVPKIGQSGWSAEWAIPLNAIGLKAKPNVKVAFNACAFVNEYGNWHCWEGTRGESWQVDQAGLLLFK